MGMMTKYEISAMIDQLSGYISTSAKWMEGKLISPVNMNDQNIHC
jgi:hypothetical protein